MHTKPARVKSTPDVDAFPPVMLSATTTPDVVKVPARLALAIEGGGSPESEAFHLCIGAIYGVTYTMKFARKKAGRTSFKVPPLEGRYWAEGWDDTSVPPPPEKWRWRLRMNVPRDVRPKELAAVVEEATGKKGGKLEGCTEVRRAFLEKIPAQRHGRILHVGPYGDEARSFKTMEPVLAANGLTLAYSHLEIYLSDPRRTAPEKLRTVLLRELA